LDYFNYIALIGLIFFDGLAAVMLYLNKRALKFDFLLLGAAALTVETLRQILNLIYIYLGDGNPDYFSQNLIELGSAGFFAASLILLLAIQNISNQTSLKLAWSLIGFYIVSRFYLAFFHEEVDRLSWYIAYAPTLVCYLAIINSAKIIVAPLKRIDYVLVSAVSAQFLLRLVQPYFIFEPNQAWSVQIYLFDSLLFPIIAAIITKRGLELLNHRYRESQKTEFESLDNIEYVLNNAHEAIIGFDHNLVITTWNQRAFDLTGFNKAEAHSRQNVLDFLVEDDRKELSQHIHNTDYSQGSIFTYHGEVTFIHKSGRSIPCEVSVRGTKVDGKINNTAIFKDITLQRKLKEDKRIMANRLQHAQKLESLGVLTGGIAHDFNNLLMGITGFAELALEESTSSSVNTKLSKILTASGKAIELTNQMLTYAGQNQVQKEDIRFDTIVEDILDLMSAVISKKATIEFKSNEPSLWLKGDATQLNQVVMNLVTNASDALDGEVGSIDIESGREALSREALNKHYFGANLLPGEYAFLSVRDTGMGMSQSAQGKLFDPFYSTKFPGRGLGMASVAGILQNHHGAAYIDSKLDYGTIIKIFLPLTEMRERSFQNDYTPKIDFKGATVLIIEDDPDVRLVSTNILENAGFKILLASEGLEGIDLFHAKHKEIDLVLLDCSLPYLSGSEIYQEMRTIEPELPVLFYSGFEKNIAIPELATLTNINFIKKPTRAEDLIKRVNEVLSQREAEIF